MIASSPILLGFIGVLLALKLAVLAVAAVLIVRSLSERFGLSKPALIAAPLSVSQPAVKRH